MKKASTILIALLAMTMSLAGCKNDKEKPSSVDPGTSTSTRAPIPVDPVTGMVTIRFYNDDELLVTASGMPGDPVTQEPSGPAKDGHVFLGWATSKTGAAVRHIATFPETSTDYYARYRVEAYLVTFEGYPEFFGQYHYGDALPEVESSEHVSFYGWRRADSPVGAAFLICPDLGIDGEEVSLVPVQDAFHLTVHFAIPAGHGSLDDVRLESLSEELPSTTITGVEGMTFDGWGLIRGSDGFATSDSPFCVTYVTEATGYADYLVEDSENEGEYFITLYPHLRKEKYNIDFRDYDGSSFTYPEEFGNPTVEYGGSLPVFTDYYRAKDGNVGTFASLRGWSRTQGLDQTTGLLKNVPDFGNDGASVTLYAVPANPVFKILFAANSDLPDAGKYASGQTSFVTEDYAIGDSFPVWNANGGYRFLNKFRVKESKTSATHTTVPNLNDRTQFNEPTNGIYTIYPVAEYLEFNNFTEFSPNLQPYASYSFPSNRATYLGQDFHSIHVGEKMFRGDSANPSITGVYYARGYTSSGFKLEACESADGSNWKTIMSGITDFTFPAMSESTYETYKNGKWRFSIEWERETYIIKLKKKIGDAAIDETKYSYVRATFGTPWYGFCTEAGSSLTQDEWISVFGLRTADFSNYTYVYIVAYYYTYDGVSWPSEKVTPNLKGMKNLMQWKITDVSGWVSDQTRLSGDAQNKQVNYLLLRMSNSSF